MGSGLSTNPDSLLNFWAMAWSYHILPLQPLSLFDANIFFPRPDTLAYSEHLFGITLLAAPVWWLSGSPLIAYNFAIGRIVFLLRAGHVLPGARVDRQPLGRHGRRHRLRRRPRRVQKLERCREARILEAFSKSAKIFCGRRAGDRVVFSAAFRRLAHKTQVHPLSDNDHVHTRLTHSIEVASVGRSMGTIIGSPIAVRLGNPQITPDTFGYIVQAACLAHDIGNPPFGHGGEDTIGGWFNVPLGDG